MGIFDSFEADRLIPVLSVGGVDVRMNAADNCREMGE